MIAENLLRAGLGRRSGTWLAEVGVDKGETLARKTLNPTLGIEGGLSILGTSGIVVPCSNAAYIKTIEVLLKGARAADCSTAVLVTGGRSLRAARAGYPELPDVSFVRIGDFIREACDYACRAGLSELIVCCMPGKLAKYAMGYEYTHAHKVAQSPSAVAGLLAEDGVPDEILSALRTSRSIREGLSRMTSENVNVTIANLASHADAAISNWAPGMELSVRVLSFDGMEWWL